MRDFHTVGAGTFRGARHSMWDPEGKLKGKTVLSTRHYLADAAFTVALGHEDGEFVRRIADALQNPVWPLFFGRRSCVPTAPVFVDLVDGRPEDCVRMVPLARGAGQRLRVVSEVERGAPGDPRPDDPLSFSSADRRFAFRHVCEDWVEYQAPAGETLA